MGHNFKIENMKCKTRNLKLETIICFRFQVSCFKNMIEINNKTRSKIDLALVQKVAQKFLKYYNKERRLATIPLGKSDHANIDKVEVSIAFVGDKIIRRLNKTYRGIDKVTDVLAFPDVMIRSDPDKGVICSGEVIINYAQVKKQASHQRRGARQAKKFNNNVKQELVFILTHGLLHLLGYDDKTEKGRLEMERLGEEFVRNFY